MVREPVVQRTVEQPQAESEPNPEPSSFRANEEIDFIHKLTQVQVSKYEALVASIIKYFEHKVAYFKAGHLRKSRNIPRAWITLSCTENHSVIVL